VNYDIVATNGPDLGIARTDVSRAGNVLSVQLASLEYAPNFGIDLKFFLESEYQLQNESFKAYCVERLLAHQVNVVNALEVLRQLDKSFIFDIGDNDNGTGLIG
jgi:hypothetical protein